MSPTMPGTPVFTSCRSLMEEMLEDLNRRGQKPKDVPPSLPARPLLRGRLPSGRRPLPINCEVESNVAECMVKESGGREGREEEQAWKEEKEMVSRSGIFGGKRTTKFVEPAESPYVRMPKPKNFGQNYEDGDRLSSVVSSSLGGPLTEMIPWGGTIDKEFQVWCQLPDVQWKLGKIQSISGEYANIFLPGGKVSMVSVENLLPANPDILDGVDDLIHLCYLNEPAVLHNLKCRHTQDLVYTKAGPVLVAINPFKAVPLYGNDLVEAYRHKTVKSPHVYAAADTAFNQMMADGVDQSIILSGESGAGKTETAKIAMQYLVALGGGSRIENEVLQANFILEAFGNAKTLRNDNSSRFGKMIEIHFSLKGRICGAKVLTLLLEKSRVVQRAKGERSYHVFYQLCAGAPPLLKEKLNIKAATGYKYLKHSDCLKIDDVDDAQRFHMLMEALDILHICREDQESVYAMLAAVLWLGNVDFTVVDNENHVEVITSEGLTNAAKLMGCKVSDLMTVLSTCEIQDGNNRIVQKLILQEAIATRDALACSIYACLFEWLVEQINRSLGAGKLHNGRAINILDIYGFESLHKNSFEQLCINYANERLEQHFSRHLLKLEQAEYIQDGIDWTNVEFVDNTECLNLLEKKPFGLLSLLDEESMFPEATDLTLTYKLKQHLNDNHCFKGEKGCAFRVCHYAGEVSYDTGFFLEKNRDLLQMNFIQLLLSCGRQLSQLFASHLLKPTHLFQQLSNVDSQKPSVATKFKGQLFELMQRLEKTEPHFIRCIKPNSQQLSGMFENELVLQQLRCGGVLEVVKISRAGYPCRMSHQQFAERYGFLVMRNMSYRDPLSVSVAVLQQFNIQPEMYQVGYAKLFFRKGQITALEDARNDAMQGILWIQKYYPFHGHQAHHNYHELEKGVTTLQSCIRGCLGRKHIMILKNQKMSKINYRNDDGESGMNLQQNKDLHDEVPRAKTPVLQNFEKGCSETQVEVRQKEEIAILQKKLQQYEMKCSENETKMKSMEEMWQQQITSLQMSVASAKKNLAANGTLVPPGKLGVCQDYDSKGAAYFEERTHEGTLGRQQCISDTGLAKNSDNKQNTVDCLSKEFEQQRQVFEDNARFLVEEKSGQSRSGANPAEELKKLKVRFATWKKEFKVRLHETKAAIRKLRNSEGKKPRRRWCCNKPCGRKTMTC